MKIYMKNNTEVEALQYDGTVESFNEILENIEEKDKHKFTHSEGSRGERVFNVICKTKVMTIHPTEWIVKDDKYHFVVSDDIFQDMFTEKN